jgi:hypothetical protein
MVEAWRKDVFLGGACGSTRWRREIAIPALDAAGVSYFNPQLGPGEWTTEREAEEMRAKAEAEVLLFVITEETRGVASVGEVAYLLAAGRRLALCVRMIPHDAAWVDAAERDDLNRGRTFVRTMAKEHSVPLFDRVEDATAHAIALLRRHREPMTLERARAIIGEVKCGSIGYGLREATAGFHLRVEGPDGLLGRWWHVPAEALESDLVRTAFLAALSWHEHELREMFLYRGERVFGPHIPVDLLRRVACGGDDPHS